jgi:hypothetical protein
LRGSIENYRTPIVVAGLKPVTTGSLRRVRIVQRFSPNSEL